MQKDSFGLAMLIILAGKGESATCYIIIHRDVRIFTEAIFSWREKRIMKLSTYLMFLMNC